MTPSKLFGLCVLLHDRCPIEVVTHPGFMDVRCMWRPRLREGAPQREWVLQKIEEEERNMWLCIIVGLTGISNDDLSGQLDSNTSA